MTAAVDLFGVTLEDPDAAAVDAAVRAVLGYADDVARVWEVSPAKVRRELARRIAAGKSR